MEQIKTKSGLTLEELGALVETIDNKLIETLRKSLRVVPLGQSCKPQDLLNFEDSNHK